MKIVEAELKHTSDVTPKVEKTSENPWDNFDWRKWKEFPRWDIAHTELPEKESIDKALAKLKDNVICKGTWSGKHHITFWKHYNTAEEYAEDNP
jgi:hypothetical protein